MKKIKLKKNLNGKIKCKNPVNFKKIRGFSNFLMYLFI